MILVEETKLIQEDRLLWKRMREGDKEALAALFRRHYALLYDYGLKLSHQEEPVKDGIQEVFAYIWEKRERIARADSVRAYLLISLRRHLLKALALQQQRQTSLQQFELEQTQDAFSPEELLIVQEQEESARQALTKALQEIPPRLREALYLKTYDGLAYREIAAVMNVSPQVARNYVSEAFHRLRLVFPP